MSDHSWYGHLWRLGAGGYRPGPVVPTPGGGCPREVLGPYGVFFANVCVFHKYVNDRKTPGRVCSKAYLRHRPENTSACAYCCVWTQYYFRRYILLLLFLLPVAGRNTH